MKINILEAHDRLLHFKKDQSNTIQQGCEDCLKSNELSLALQDKSHYIYIFAHPRTSDDGFKKRLLWQPRLTKPKPQTNSYLFRATSHTDLIEICWILPPEEMWGQYEKGLVTENEIVMWSIDQYKNNRESLAKDHPEDLLDSQAFNIMKNIVIEKNQDKVFKRTYGIRA